MNFHSKKTKAKGVVLIEVIVAVSIVTLTVFALILSVQKALSLSGHALHQSRASFLMQEGVNALYIVRDTGWSTIDGLSLSTDYYLEFIGGTWTATSSLQTIGKYTRTFQISNVNRNILTDDIASIGLDDSNTKKVDLSVSWSEGGEAYNEEMSFYLINSFSS
ncbi:MAG: hypothetical protein ACI9AR_000099 [Flavobacteriaceae bacterium]|jgi:hypothetical protein